VNQVTEQAKGRTIVAPQSNKRGVSQHTGHYFQACTAAGKVVAGWCLCTPGFVLFQRRDETFWLEEADAVGFMPISVSISVGSIDATVAIAGRGPLAWRGTTARRADFAADLHDINEGGRKDKERCKTIK